MPALAEALLVTLLIAGAVGVVVLWFGARLVRRITTRGRARALELRPRFLPPGPRRDAAMLRHRLATELQTTARMFAAAPYNRIFQADPAAVLADAAELAAQLDDELAVVEAFPDFAQQRAALATVAPQALQLMETLYSARNTMLRTAAVDRERELSRLSESVAHEAESLRAYEGRGRDLAL